MCVHTLVSSTLKQEMDYNISWAVAVASVRFSFSCTRIVPNESILPGVNSARSDLWYVNKGMNSSCCVQPGTNDNK